MISSKELKFRIQNIYEFIISEFSHRSLSSLSCLWSRAWGGCTSTRDSSQGELARSMTTHNLMGRRTLLGTVWCVWPMLSSRAMQKSVVCAPAWNHVNILPGAVLMWMAWGLCCLQTNWRPMIHGPADCEEQGDHLCHVIDDHRCIVESEDHGRLLWQPLHPISQSNNLDKKPPKRILKKWDGDAEE